MIKLMNERLLTAPFLHVDETYLQVLKSEKAFDTDHFIVVRAGGPPGERVVLYDYIPSRTTAALKQLLIGEDKVPYRSNLLTDGLELYDGVCAQLRILHFGCWHCRTYYFKATKVSELPASHSLARLALDEHIRKLYAVGRKIKAQREAAEARGEALPLSAVLKLRQEESVPILRAFKEWIDTLAWRAAQEHAR